MAPFKNYYPLPIPLDVAMQMLVTHMVVMEDKLIPLGIGLNQQE